MGENVSGRQWVILDVGLGFVAVLLLFNLFQVQLPNVGWISYQLDPVQPLCIVQWQDTQTVWDDMDRCCLEARKQLTCQQEISSLGTEPLHWACQTGSGEVLRYRLNNKAYLYCTQQVIWG